MDAERYVLPQYIVTDPTKPPVPAGAEGPDIVVNLFPEEDENFALPRTSGGVMGTVKALYRALGFGSTPAAEPEPQSRKTALIRRKGSLYK